MAANDPASLADARLVNAITDAIGQVLERELTAFRLEMQAELAALDKRVTTVHQEALRVLTRQSERSTSP